jgi:ketosteroid isomerase-like protein
MKQPPLILALAFTLANLATAQTSGPEDPVHQELRVLRTNVVEAISRGDFDRTLTYVHTNVVVTWQNAEVCRGHAGLRSFFERMGKDAFKGYKVPPQPEELTILYGGKTGISFGHTVAHYSLFGKDYDFTNRWTATLVNQDGRWQLAAYHVSNDILNNPLINTAKSGLVWMGGLGLGTGLVVGVLVGRRGRRPAAA